MSRISRTLQRKAQRELAYGKAMGANMEAFKRHIEKDLSVKHHKQAEIAEQKNFDRHLVTFLAIAGKILMEHWSDLSKRQTRVATFGNYFMQTFENADDAKLRQIIKDMGKLGIRLRIQDDKLVIDMEVSKDGKKQKAQKDSTGPER